MSVPAPRLGVVRCYWALLQPSYAPGPNGKLELKFVYLDPVLGQHLAAQQVSIMQRGVIEFIHPAEREQARNDLASAMQSDDLQGSVTRMRFARLSRIRAILGCPPQDNAVPSDMSTVTEDDDYLIIDLVLNWVADGLLLAFFHAIKDKDPVANNDPARRHEGWSNFCGTTAMPEEQIQALKQSIATHIVPPPRTRHPPTRIFQLHSNMSRGGGNGPIFTWPPPRPASQPVQYDGLYDADEYADLMRGVDMDPNQLAAKPGETRTNCTTRFGAEHSIRTEGVHRHVNSVFIPYGSVIFACFQTTKLYEIPSPMTPTAADGWSQNQSNAVTGSIHSAGAVPPRDWRGGGGAEYEAAPYNNGAAHYEQYPPAAPHHYPHYTADGQPPAAPAFHHAPHLSAQSDGTPTPPRASGSTSTRPLVRPPGDVEKCRGCGTRESPEWRKGENGVKDLCNACGLKLARAVAKREGRQKPRKKDKA